MKKEQTIHSIIYATMLIACIAMIALLLAACQHEETGPEPNKTPLTMGSINIRQGAGARFHADTRATPAEDFFKDGDYLEIYMDVEPYHTITEWNGTSFDPFKNPIYFEDVYNAADNKQTADIHATFGSELLIVDQTTEASLHWADFIRGDLTVDPATRTLTCAAMTHQLTQLIISIAKGEGWDSDEDFLAHLTGYCYIHTTNGFRVYPYVIARDEAIQLTAIQLTAILPPNEIPTNTGDDILTLTVPGIDEYTRTLRLAEPITPQAGQSIIITATYHNKGTFTGITATLEEWKDITHSGELPAVSDAFREAERQRFLDWADDTNPESWRTQDFTLQCDIDLQEIDFEPIGSLDIGPFTKTFDGGGHTISGLMINKSDDDGIGLFGLIEYIGTVRNLTVVGSVTGQDLVGGITGMNAGTITGCTFRGTVTGSNVADGIVGGIVGVNTNLIAGCRVANSTITATNCIGGIAGINMGNTPGIIACLADGVTLETTGTEAAFLGGIAGINAASLTACVSASITLTAPNITDPTRIHAGDIAGDNLNTTPTACIPLGPDGATLTDAQILDLKTAIGNLCNFHWQANPASPVGAYVKMKNEE